MSESLFKRRMGLKRALCWLVPYATIAFWIGSCRLLSPIRDEQNNPPSFVAAKIGVIVLLAGIVSVLVWEDFRALCRTRNPSENPGPD